MKNIYHWLREHPFVGCFFTAVISSLLTAYGLLCVLRAPPSWDDSLAVCGIVVGIGMMYIGTRRHDAARGPKLPLIGALLFAPLLSAQDVPREPVPGPEPLPLVIAGGVLVVVLGGIIGCKAVRKCSKIAGARTNQWPDELHLDTDEYGAFFATPESGYCSDDSLPVIPTTAQLFISVAQGPRLHVSIRAEAGWQFSQSYEAAQQEAQSHGLEIPSWPIVLTSYERNRIPCKREDADLSYDRETHTVTVGAGGVLVVVERSADWKSWEPVMRVNIPEDSKLAVDDVAGPAMNYRITARAP